MRMATATLESVAPYSQGRFHNTPKIDKELADKYEERTWRNRMHVTEEGYVFIPPMSFKLCLAECAKFLSIQIRGRGKATYTKHFEAGVLCMEPLVLPNKAKEVEGQWLHVPSDGRRGGSTRVLRCFPIIHKWGGDVEFHVLDETIDNETFQHHLEEAGRFIGVGRFRPRNNGFFGRFQVNKIRWS